MRWVLGIVGVLVLLVAIVLVVGAMLPKSHVASRSARYAAAPDTLWASLTNARAFPTWRTDVTRVETLPDENGQRGWREHGKNGVIPYRVVESVAPRRLVTRIADPKLPFGGTLDVRTDSGWRRHAPNDHGAWRGLQPGLPVRLPLLHGLHLHDGRRSPRPRNEAWRDRYTRIGGCCLTRNADAEL